MLKHFFLPLGIVALINLSILINGCSMLQTLKKPEISPNDNQLAQKTNLQVVEQFMSPPVELYDLETTTGAIFESIIKNDWPLASTEVINLEKLWSKAKTLIGDKKGINEADLAISELMKSVAEKNPMDSYELLNKFMVNVSNISQSYKLSPLSNIIDINNAIRRVSFYTVINDWHKANIKMKELDLTWNKAKPPLETFGLFSKVTTNHSIIKQLKDAVDAENKTAVREYMTKINGTMTYIKDYYRNK